MGNADEKNISCLIFSLTDFLLIKFKQFSTSKTESAISIAIGMKDYLLSSIFQQLTKSDFTFLSRSTI